MINLLANDIYCGPISHHSMGSGATGQQKVHVGVEVIVVLTTVQS